MDELSGWMATSDLIPDPPATGTAPPGTLKGMQSVQTYMIGFGNSISGSEDYLDEIALRGGTGQAYLATDPESLTTTLQSIFGDIQQDSGTFVTPSVAVNAFNRAQTSDDLYFSLFKVGKSAHWAGNLKKYKLMRSTTTDPPQIVDSKDKAAVNAKGLRRWHDELLVRHDGRRQRRARRRRQRAVGAGFASALHIDGQHDDRQRQERDQHHQHDRCARWVRDRARPVARRAQRASHGCAASTST